MKLTQQYAANAVSARARAIYGKTLRREDYEALLACHSVSEAAAYLKNETSYSDALADINEKTIHRGYLEERLRRRLWTCYASLIRFDISAGSRLSAYLMQREETEHLIQLLRLMNVDRARDYILSLPDFFSSHTKLDLLAVNRAQNMAELVPALAGSLYGRLLSPYAGQPNGELPLTEMETVLHRALAERILDVTAHTTGTLRQEMVDLCGTWIDVQNVTRVWRLKTYFHATEEEIRAVLLPPGGNIPKKTWERLLAAAPDEMADIFFATPAGRHVPAAQRAFTFDLPERATYFTARHYMHFSVHPMVVLLSYVTIIETEVLDIINIIEGLRYQLPPEEIRPTLVLGAERM